MIVVVVFRRKASIKGNHTERDVIDKELSVQTTYNISSERWIIVCNMYVIKNYIIEFSLNIKLKVSSVWQCIDT